MECVTDLVDALFLFILECAVTVEGVLFEKETNFVAGSEKVVVCEAVLLVSGEDGNDRGRIELLDQLLGPRAQYVAFAVVSEAFENKKALLVVLRKLFVRDHRVILSSLRQL